jgi:hypothetical protein
LDELIFMGIIHPKSYFFQNALVQVANKQTFFQYFDKSITVSSEMFNMAMYRCKNYILEKIIPCLKDPELNKFCHCIESLYSLKMFLKMKGTIYAFEKLNGLTSVETHLLNGTDFIAYYLMELGVHPMSCMKVRRVEKVFKRITRERRIGVVTAIEIIQRNLNTISVKGTSKRGWKRAIVSTAKLPSHLSRYIVSFI